MKASVSVTVALLALLASLLAAGCGGSGASGGDNSTATAGGTASGGFDPNLLSAVVLQPEEAPAGFTGVGGFAPNRGIAASFSSAFSGSGLQIQSTVARYNTPALRDANVDQIRRSLAGLVGKESNFDLPGSDAAFIYAGTNPERHVLLAFRGPYIIATTLMATDPSGNAASANTGDLARYTTVVLGRVQQLIDNPASITPIAGMPTFDTSVPTATPRPSP